MTNWKPYFFLFFIGAIGYSLLELAWRGRTHWTMALTGGFCVLVLYGIAQALPREPLLVKSIYGAFTITAIEFWVGCLVNLHLHMGVWDYTAMPYNLLGQICPFYTILWFFLCLFCFGIYHFYLK